MPEKMQRLSTEELNKLLERRQPSPRALERRRAYEEIRNFLASIPPGEGGEIWLKEGEKRITVKNRLKRAAKELGVELEFFRTRKRIVFRVKPKEGEQEGGEEAAS